MNVVSAAAMTLSERLPPTLMRRLADSLPPEVRRVFPPEREGEPEQFGVDEFVRRTSERAGVSPGELVHQLRAVTEVIQESAAGDVLADIYRALPYDVRQLFDAGPPPEESRSTTG